jgi:hypothetical protein
MTVGDAAQSAAVSRPGGPGRQCQDRHSGAGSARPSRAPAECRSGPSSDPAGAVPDEEPQRRSGPYMRRRTRPAEVTCRIKAAGVRASLDACCLEPQPYKPSSFYRELDSLLMYAALSSSAAPMDPVTGEAEGVQKRQPPAPHAKRHTPHCAPWGRTARSPRAAPRQEATSAADTAVTAPCSRTALPPRRSSPAPVPQEAARHRVAAAVQVGAEPARRCRGVQAACPAAGGRPLFKCRFHTRSWPRATAVA